MPEILLDLRSRKILASWLLDNLPFRPESIPAERWRQLRAAEVAALATDELKVLIDATDPELLDLLMWPALRRNHARPPA